MLEITYGNRINFNEKSEPDADYAITISSSGSDIVIDVKKDNDHVQTWKVPVTSKGGLFIDCRADTVCRASAGNCATVWGNVGKAEACNCINVEGISDRSKAGNRVCQNTSLRVEWGKKEYVRQFPRGYRDYATPNILRIRADKIASIAVRVKNVSCETLIVGSVDNINVGNVLSVRGRVEKAKADNMIITSTKRVPSSRMPRRKAA